MWSYTNNTMKRFFLNNTYKDSTSTYRPNVHNYNIVNVWIVLLLNRFFQNTEW